MENNITSVKDREEARMMRLMAYRNAIMAKVKETEKARREAESAQDDKKE